MKVLYWTMLNYALAFMFHMAWWRVFPPKKHTLALLEIFFLFYTIGCIVLWKFPTPIGIYTPNSIPEFIYSTIFYFSMVFGYVCFYSVLEVDSPGLMIVNTTAKYGTDGATMDDLSVIFENNPFTDSRIGHMELDKLVYKKRDKYLPTPKGLFLMKLITFYRDLLGIQKGG
ncbi:MAG: hypothetical protein HQL01_05395 [Nitrospirae bacterium]|nr:hypothetical protein [Nitrospirota bacterium]